MTLPGETEAGSAGDATMPRDNLVGSSSRGLAAREALLSRCTLTTRNESSDDETLVL